MTATVTPAAATGTVTFYSGTTVLETEPLGSGKAVLNTVFLPSGVDSIRAFYGGDGTYAASSSNVLTQTVNAGAANGFLVPVNYYVAGGPLGIASGDFNRDGNVDFATIEFNAFSIVLGKGDGTFQYSVQYPVPNSGTNDAYDIAVGDFNGDGKADLVIPQYNSQTIGVYLGNGDGTFQPPISSSVCSTATGPNGPIGPTGLEVGDFNGDGKEDLALKCGSIQVLLGNGDGTFVTGATLGDPNVQYPQSLVLGDFNGDGVTDIAEGTVTLGSYLGGVALWLGNGDGTFQSPVQSSFAGYPTVIAAGDFNVDGKLDLALNSGSVNQPWVVVMMGKGDGTFQAPIQYGTTDAPGSLAVADFNGDGKLDLAASTSSSEHSGAVAILFGDGDGTFQQSVSYPIAMPKNYSPYSMGVADLNKDGRADLVIPCQGPSNVIAVLLGNPGAATSTTMNSSPNPSPFGTTVSLSATVTPSTATGSVTFQDGTASLGSATLAGGIATIDVSTLSTGKHSLTAFYQGDANDGNSVSPAATQTVVQAASSSLLASSPNPSVFGQGVGFAATVSPSTATGAMTLMAGSTILGTATINGGQALFSTSKFPVGSHGIVAQYSGDINYLTSASPVLTQSVGKAPTETVLTSAPNPSSVGQAVILTATVLPVTATGAVQFFKGSTLLGTSNLSGGKATFSATSFPKGSLTLFAIYAGDTNDSTSKSSRITQTVQ